MLYDEYFYTNINNPEITIVNKTIKENITLLQEGTELLENAGNILAFGSIFTGPFGKASSFVTNKLFDNLNDTAKENINGKIKKIARNEETAELLKTLNETSSTSETIILNELVQRQQDEITKLSTKYNKISVQNIYDNTDSSEEKFELVDGIRELKRWIDVSNSEKYSQEIRQKTYDTFNNLSQIGIATGCEDLTKMANTATSSLIINDSIKELSNLSTELSSGSSLLSAINPITSLLCVGVGLFNMFKKKKKSNNAHMQLMVNQLNEIKQQLHSIHYEMREQFKNVFSYLENITEKLHMQYMISINTYYKIEQVEKSINNINIICEYYGKQNLLQDLFRTVYKITQGNDEYYRNLSQTSFNELFMDLFYWLNSHSFDYGTNGYIYASTSGNIINNLNSSVNNRIGYLAHLLNFQHSPNMVNYEIFHNCVNALAILIRQGLMYYENLPLSFDAIIPIMNRANLTEQFIDYTRQPQVLQNQLTQYNQLVDQLRANLLQWIDSTRYKIQYNIHNMTLDQMISATPISTGVRYASDIDGQFPNIPVELASQSSSILQTYKLCEVAIKLGLGHYDFRFGLSHGNIYGWRKIPVTICILMEFILNGSRYCINNEQWYAPGTTVESNGTLSGNCLLGWWQHDYKSQNWTLQNHTPSNTYLDGVLRKACEDKLNSIRQEMTSPSYTIGTQLNTLCDKLQEKYIIISKLFELNNTELEHLNSGIWIKTRLIQLINHENTFGHNVISFCDFVKEKALKVMSLNYNSSSIKENIRHSINLLSELSSDVIRYQEEYKFIQENKTLAKIQYEKLIQEEQLLITQKLEEKRQQELKELEEKRQQEVQQIIQEVKATKELEIKNINQIGIQVGRILTINSIIKKLEESNNNIQADIIKVYFEKELETELKEQAEELNTLNMLLFNTGFCNGSSMVLLEISMCAELSNYPQTILNIQMSGYQILQKIMLNSSKSIKDTMSKFLLDDISNKSASSWEFL